MHLGLLRPDLRRGGGRGRGEQWNCFFCRQASEHLLADFLDLPAERLAVLHGEIIQERTPQILLLQLLGVRKLEGDAPKT